MTLTAPSAAELRELGRRYGVQLSDAEAEDYRRLMEEPLRSCARLAELDEPRLTAVHDRDPGRAPEPPENPMNAWYWRCAIRGADDGPLAGTSVAIKDNVCVAGIPMMNGSVTLAGFVPESDATVVSRILAAGGEIAGKTVCEPLCISDGSHLADTGPVRNPHDPLRSAGGSSSGNAAVVAAGDCDVAIGSDVAGSIRMPAALCGIYGLKPTYGTVPCTGMFPIERTLDHLGPMGARVRDVALLLEAIAGPDGLDARQATAPPLGAMNQLDGGIDGLRIGLVDEGFGLPGSDPLVDETVRVATRAMADLGACPQRVSIPWHRDGEHVWAGIALEGAVDLIFRGNGAVTNVHDITLDSALSEAFALGRVAHAARLSEPAKMLLLTGEHLRLAHGGRFYARARRLLPALRAAYDAALDRFDVLVMPTVPVTAPLLPGAGASAAERMAATFGLHANTCPFNATGHPAISIPCGAVGDLPVGLMAVAAAGADGLLLRLARACESSGLAPDPARAGCRANPSARAWSRTRRRSSVAAGDPMRRELR